MALSIDPATRVITVPQADLTLVSGTVYRMDTESYFRQGLMALLDDEDYIWMPDAFTHNTEYTVAGVTYARAIQIINNYTVEFSPNSQWSVVLEGSNNDIWDVINGILVQNQVQVIPTNSAGLQVVQTGSGVTEQDKDDIRDRVWNANESDFQLAGTMGRWLSFIRKLLGNKASVAADGSKTEIFDDDKATVYHEFSHSDTRNRDPQ